LAWETLFPTMGPLPVTSQTRAMWTLRYFYKQPVPDESCEDGSKKPICKT
jgi:hypothetical protein